MNKIAFKNENFASTEEPSYVVDCGLNFLTQLWLKGDISIVKNDALLYF